MTGAACRLWGVLLPALALSGCFDVHRVDLVLDDFDDGDLYPSDRDFDEWQCSAFNPRGGSDYGCDHDGSPGAYSLLLHASVLDPYDGKPQSGGAVVETPLFQSVPPLDFSGVTEFSFDAKLEFDIDPSSEASLNFEIGCSKATAEDGTTPDDLFVEVPVRYQPVWTRFAVQTKDLINPTWPGTWKVKGGAAECLRLVDSVRFSVDAGLQDGQSGSFTLHVDRIWYQ